MAISPPAAPAVPAFPTPGPYVAQLDAAQAQLAAELDQSEGWVEQGVKDGVRLSRKVNADDADGLPTVRGECSVAGVTSDQFLNVIGLPGMRKRWDSRFKEGFMLEHFNPNTYSFYSCMAGFGWIVSPRDIVGANRNIVSSEPNSEIIVVQTSVVDDAHAPVQSGRTRATLSLSGWRLRPQGDDLDVTYMVRINLNGSLPRAIVDKVASEIPLCTARARDTFYKTGFAPYTRPSADQPTPSCIIQVENFSDPDAAKLEYQCRITTKDGGKFTIVYDATKMFVGGVAVRVEPVGAGVSASDDGAGLVAIECTSNDELVDLFVSSR